MPTDRFVRRRSAGRPAGRRGCALAALLALALPTSIPGIHHAAHAATTATTAVGAVAGDAPFVSRMTARWTPFKDSAGRTWAARSPSLGTLHYSTLLAGTDIAGTDEDELYAANAFGVTGYRLAVPRRGAYDVRLLMAEDFYGAKGKRVFDVEAEGAPVAQQVDIVAAAGKAAAHDVTFRVHVDDGALDLRFVAHQDLPLISAIEVIEAPAETFAWRMSARGIPITDTQGRVWQRMGTNFGTSRRVTDLLGRDVTGTDDDDLFRLGGVATRGMLVPVPAKADYRVRLLMADGEWAEPGRRVFDVTAEGRRVASGVDIVAAVGQGAAHEVSFPVRVEDGMLTIQFTAHAGLTLVSAIEVTSTDPAARAELGDPALIPLPDTSVYHQRVDAAPVAPDSVVLMDRLRQDIGAVPAAVNAYNYNASIYRATPATPRTTLEFEDCQNKGYVPHGLFDQGAYFVDVPIPDDALAAQGTDAQLSIYEAATDRMWEFWQVKRTPSGGWSACWGGRIDSLSNSHGVFPVPFGATASGLVMAGGVIGIQEAARGEIDHAIYLTVKEASTLISYPANRTDGASADPGHLREGQRLRLDPSLDVTTLGLTPLGEVIARAAQRYGFIVSDRAGSVGLATQSGRAQEHRTGINPWDVLLGGPAHSVMAKFPWDRVEALEVDYGKPDDS